MPYDSNDEWYDETPQSAAEAAAAKAAAQDAHYKAEYDRLKAAGYSNSAIATIYGGFDGMAKYTGISTPTMSVQDATTYASTPAGQAQAAQIAAEAAAKQAEADKATRTASALKAFQDAGGWIGSNGGAQWSNYTDNGFNQYMSSLFGAYQSASQGLDRKLTQSHFILYNSGKGSPNPNLDAAIQYASYMRGEMGNDDAAIASRLGVPLAMDAQTKAAADAAANANADQLAKSQKKNGGLLDNPLVQLAALAAIVYTGGAAAGLFEAAASEAVAAGSCTLAEANAAAAAATAAAGGGAEAAAAAATAALGGSGEAAAAVQAAIPAVTETAATVASGAASTATAAGEIIGGTAVSDAAAAATTAAPVAADAAATAAATTAAPSFSTIAESALKRVGMNIVMQEISTGQIDWGKVGVAGVTGAAMPFAPAIDTGLPSWANAGLINAGATAISGGSPAQIALGGIIGSGTSAASTALQDAGMSKDLANATAGFGAGIASGQDPLAAAAGAAGQYAWQQITSASPMTPSQDETSDWSRGDPNAMESNTNITPMPQDTATGKYTASDGTEFNTQDEAMAHDEMARITESDARQQEIDMNQENIDSGLNADGTPKPDNTMMSTAPLLGAAIAKVFSPSPDQPSQGADVAQTPQAPQAPQAPQPTFAGVIPHAARYRNMGIADQWAAIAQATKTNSNRLQA